MNKILFSLLVVVLVAATSPCWAQLSVTSPADGTTLQVNEELWVEGETTNSSATAVRVYVNNFPAFTAPVEEGSWARMMTLDQPDDYVIKQVLLDAEGNTLAEAESKIKVTAEAPTEEAPVVEPPTEGTSDVSTETLPAVGDLVLETPKDGTEIFLTDEGDAVPFLNVRGQAPKDVDQVRLKLMGDGRRPVTKFIKVTKDGDFEAKLPVAPGKLELKLEAKAIGADGTVMETVTSDFSALEPEREEEPETTTTEPSPTKAAAPTKPVDGTATIMVANPKAETEFATGKVAVNGGVAYEGNLGPTHVVGQLFTGTPSKPVRKFRTEINDAGGWETVLKGLKPDEYLLTLKAVRGKDDTEATYGKAEVKFKVLEGEPGWWSQLWSGVGGWFAARWDWVKGLSPTSWLNWGGWAWILVIPLYLLGNRLAGAVDQRRWRAGGLYAIGIVLSTMVAISSLGWFWGGICTVLGAGFGLAYYLWRQKAKTPPTSPWHAIWLILLGLWRLLTHYFLGRPGVVAYQEVASGTVYHDGTTVQVQLGGPVQELVPVVDGAVSPGMRYRYRCEGQDGFVTAFNPATGRVQARPDQVIVGTAGEIPKPQLRLEVRLPRRLRGTRMRLTIEFVP